MAYLKKKNQEELLQLLDIVSNGSWKEIERNNNSWGDCLVHSDDYLKIEKEWKEKAKRLRKSIE